MKGAPSLVDAELDETEACKFVLACILLTYDSVHQSLTLLPSWLFVGLLWTNDREFTATCPVCPRRGLKVVYDRPVKRATSWLLKMSWNAHQSHPQAAFGPMANSRQHKRSQSQARYNAQEADDRQDGWFGQRDKPAKATRLDIVTDYQQGVKCSPYQSR